MTITRRAFALSASAAAFAFPAIGKSAATAPARTDAIDARSPFLSIEGRTANLPNGGVRAGFPGVVVRAKFSGTRFILKSTASSDTQWVDISVDGGPPKIVHLATGSHDLLVYDGIAGEHMIEVARRNESWEGVWDIAGASVPGGQLLAPPALPAKKLLFIGDSVTCGGASDVMRDDARQDLSFDDGQNSYGKVLARRLNAQCHLVSYGGRGLIRDWQGIRDTRNAPQFYELAAPDEPSISWDATRYVPDAIGIMLGTNDFNQGIPDQNEFTNAFVQFIEKVRRDAPLAPVFLMDSPIVTDAGIPKRTVLASYINDVVQHIGSPLVTHASVGYYPGRPSNPHPIAEDHVKIADEVEPVFRKALGF